MRVQELIDLLHNYDPRLEVLTFNPQRETPPQRIMCTETHQRLLNTVLLLTSESEGQS